MTPPLTPPITFQQAMQHHRAGRLAEAESLYRACVAEHPNLVPAWGNLGIVLQNLRRPAEAAECFRRIAQLEPRNAQAFNHLGMNLGMAGRFDESVEALQTATRLDPALGSAFSNLSMALRGVGRRDDALLAARRAVELDPRDSASQINLAAALIALNRQAEAIEPARRAIALQPDQPQSHFNLALALIATQQWNDALTSLRRAAALAPNHAEIHEQMIRLLRDAGQLTEALACCRKLLAAEPDVVGYHHLAATILHSAGQVTGAIAEYDRALELDPTLHATASSRLLAMHYLPQSPQALFDAHLQWAKKHTSSIAPHVRHGNDTNPDRPLRIGYVSPDFRQHSVARFLDAPLRAHDREQFERYLYCDVEVHDDVTADFVSRATQFRRSFGMDYLHLSDLVRSDNIDILIDCAGHSGGNRLIAFASKPAPVQVTFLGYPNGTGLEAIDYRITDTIADPPGSDSLYVEQLVRLPIAWCYTATQPARNAKIAPRAADAPINFGSFNTIAKLSAAWIESVARILDRVPRSTLTIKSLAFRDEGTITQVRERFATHGIAGKRLNLVRPHRDHVEHFESYNEIDIALDTFPYHGTTTTCDALWMGVPVVTLGGEAHVSRVGASLLSAVGLHDHLATSVQHYEDLAVALASDHARRNDLRSTLRQRMQSSPLMDAESYTRSLECAYRDMWRTWCAWRSGDE